MSMRTKENYLILRYEITNDPNTRGYRGMTDAQIADDLNTSYVNAPRDTLTGAEIWEAVTASEFDLLTPLQQKRLEIIVSLGDSIPIVAGSKTRTELLAMFGAGTATRAALVAVTIPTQSRAAQLGLPDISAAQVTQAKGY